MYKQYPENKTPRVPAIKILLKNGRFMHEGKVPTQDEIFSPTLLCVLVVNWLKTIDKGLPSIVRQRFSTQLRSHTIYSLRNEISDAIPSMLEEIEEKASINRLGSFPDSKFSRTPNYKSKVRKEATTPSILIQLTYEEFWDSNKKV